MQMISNRGQEYAESGPMTGYSRDKNEVYNKQTNPNGEVSFANAENFAMHDEVLNYINAHYEFDASHITYNEGPIGTKHLREAMASHLNDYFNPFAPVTSEHVTFTAGVTGLNEIIAFTDEGDGILLGRPTYGSFYDDLKTKSRCELVYTSFDDIDQFSIAAVNKYEAEIIQAVKDGVTIRALLLCNPHNPIGKCYAAEVLKAYFQLCNKYNIHLVSDEIYGLSVFDVKDSKRTPFTSVLSINPTGLLRTDQIHVLYGMSQNFGAAGLRLGCLISQNKEMTRATRAIGFVWPALPKPIADAKTRRFYWPSEMSCAIATSILEDKPFVAEYTKKSRKVLSERYALATKILDESVIDYVRDGNAGFFLWIDLSTYLSDSTASVAGWEAEAALKTAILEAGVDLPSGFKYKEERPGWFRVLFTVEKDALKEGLQRIIKTARNHMI